MIRPALSLSLNKFVDLIETYFNSFGGYQIQWNIQNRETYEAAMEKPEEYKNIIVRVGGFSAYYVELGKALQQQIIDRTEQMIV